MGISEQVKQWKGLWLPEGETHQVMWMARNGVEVDGRPTYQYHKYKAARNACKQLRVAIDVGANVGLWSRVMLLDFAAVHSFEPVPLYRKCLELNAPEATIYPYALGNKPDTVDMACRTQGSYGDTAPASGRDGEFIVAKDVKIVTLDSLAIKDVDLIKIDCEGFESFVVEGAEQTIKTYKPVIIVEQKKGNGKAFALPDDHAVKILQSWGMHVEREMSGDYIMSF